MARGRKTTVATENVATVSNIDNAVVVDDVVEVVEPLTDDTEIDVVAIVSGVSYYDRINDERYEWDNVGDIEVMTYKAIKVMWRHYKSYFKELKLKPNDERVIKTLGLTNTYKSYDNLLKVNNYTKDNINSVIEEIKGVPNGTKSSIYQKIRLWVNQGELTNVYVIRAIENGLGLDLFDLIP